jgi:uncharacterized RDD family membrane protein YckC
VTYASPSPVPYANWAQRVGAALIDGIIPAVIAIIGLILSGAAHSFIVYLLFWLAAIAVSIYNRAFLAGQTGQSWGKRVLGLRLVSENTGQPIGAGMAFVRDIAHFVDGIICYIGYLFPLWDAKRQTLADKIMSTLVVPA